MFHKTVSISGESQIGFPFSKSYWRPTPMFWRITGDILGSLGQLFGILGISTQNLTFAMIASIGGWIAKIITNGISYKNLKTK